MGKHEGTDKSGLTTTSPALVTRAQVPSPSGTEAPGCKQELCSFVLAPSTTGRVLARPQDGGAGGGGL